MKTCGEEGGFIKDTGEGCSRAAGWGTSHRGRGLCKTHQAETKRQGKPTKYHPDMLKKARDAALLGATNEEMAEVLGIGLSTLGKLKARYIALREAIKDGKHRPDVEVAHAMFDNAMGAEWTDQEVVKIKRTEYGPTGKKLLEQEEAVAVDVVRRKAPDTLAGIFWLKNRHRFHWADRKAITHDGMIQTTAPDVHIYIPDNRRAPTGNGGRPAVVAARLAKAGVATAGDNGDGEP